jgi:hypothetical protein
MISRQERKERKEVELELFALRSLRALREEFMAIKALDRGDSPFLSPAASGPPAPKPWSRSPAVTLPSACILGSISKCLGSKPGFVCSFFFVWFMLPVAGLSVRTSASSYSVVNVRVSFRETYVYLLYLANHRLMGPDNCARNP